VKTLENTGFFENTVFPKTGGEIHFWGKIRCFWGFSAFLGKFLGTNYWQNQKGKGIQDIAIDNNLSYKEELESTILSLSEEKGIVYAIKHNKTRHNKNKGGCHCQCCQRVALGRRC
jgi:hypothetical protein